jgi:hypothetical protein
MIMLSVCTLLSAESQYYINPTIYQYSPNEFLQFQKSILDSSAGSSALSSIDFSNSKSKFSLGFGLGTSSSTFVYEGINTSIAAGLGFRFKVTDFDSVQGKGYIGNNGSSSVSIGYVHDF